MYICLRCLHPTDTEQPYLCRNCAEYTGQGKVVIMKEETISWTVKFGDGTVKKYSVMMKM